MRIINTTVNNNHFDTSSQVALLAQFVNTGHNVRIVIAFVARGVTATETVGASRAAGVGVVRYTRNLTLGLFQLPDGGHLLDRSP
jgi:hypothetical protein